VNKQEIFVEEVTDKIECGRIDLLDRWSGKDIKKIQIFLK
jgi:hypothetical protein